VVRRSIVGRSTKGMFYLLATGLMVFTLAVLVKTLPNQTRLFSKASSTVVLSDDFTNLNDWTVNGADSSSGQVTTPNVSFNGKTAVKLVKSTNSALCLSRNITASNNIRVEVQFYDDFNAANPNASLTTGSFVSLRNDKLVNLPQITVGVKGGKYVQTVDGMVKDFYFLRLGDNAPPVGSSLIVDSNSFVARRAGWHKLSLINTPMGSYVEIDGVNTAYLPVFNGVSKGFVQNIGLANQIIICNSWFNGAAYYANLTVSTPAVENYPGPEEALYQPVFNYLSQYSPYTVEQISKMESGVSKDWYTADTLCRLAADDAAASAIVWRKTGQSTYRDRAVNSLNTVFNLPVCYAKWQAGVPLVNVHVYPAILATWFLWSDLSPELKQLTTNIIANELNFYSTFNPANRWAGDSAAEENSWIALDLWLGSHLFSQHPNASIWRAKADVYAFHSLTSGESYNGLITQTLEPGFYVQNHGVRNNSYQLLSLGQLSNAFLFADKTNTEKPSAGTFGHNYAETWNAVKASLDPTTFLNFIDKPKGTWPIPLSRGLKDEYGLDPYYHINTLLYLQKYGYAPSIFDDTLRQGWYLYNDITVMPLGGTNCLENANVLSCSWRYPFSIDPELHISLNEYRRRVYNSVAAGERFNFTAAIFDQKIVLPSSLTYDLKTTSTPTSSSGLIPSATSGVINNFISATKLTNSRTFHFDANSNLDLVSWVDNLTDNKTLRIYFYDDATKKIGMNFGWQTTDKTAGLGLQVNNVSSSASACTKLHLRAALTTRCYTVRIKGQAASNEQSTLLTRTTGWHFVDFTNQAGVYTMNLDGIKSYSFSSAAPLTYFYIASSNWKIPTNSDFVVLKI
jgi:hypothetical protein